MYSSHDISPFQWQLLLLLIFVTIDTQSSFILPPTSCFQSVRAVAQEVASEGQ